MSEAPHQPTDQDLRDSAALRAAVQQFIRSMGLLRSHQTPCGQPLSVAHAHTLMFLLGRPTDAPGPTQQVIADHLNLDKSTVHRLLSKLRDRGLVRIDACSTDKRARCLSLTDQGRSVAATVDTASRGLFSRLSGQLPVGQGGEIAAAVRHLTHAIEALHGEE